MQWSSGFVCCMERSPSANIAMCNVQDLFAVRDGCPLKDNITAVLWVCPVCVMATIRKAAMLNTMGSSASVISWW